ncbi:MAG: hypothetical protein EAX95_03635 [Candidatus Thorarchaeota archaeon]|nr:hypothetical protein [Candidatus Thorarchaeota archaeon]
MVINLARKGQLIAVNHTRIVFPDKCPVCGKPATDQGAIPAVPRADRLQARKLYDGSFPSSRVVASTRSMPTVGAISSISIPTCEMHAISFEDIGRIRGPLSLINGLLIMATLLLSPFTILALLANIPVNSNLLVIIALAAFLSVVTYYFSGPTSLERTVSVFDISYGVTILRISNNDYAEELLRLNPMTADRLAPN